MHQRQHSLLYIHCLCQHAIDIYQFQTIMHLFLTRCNHRLFVCIGAVSLWTTIHSCFHQRHSGVLRDVNVYCLPVSKSTPVCWVLATFFLSGIFHRLWFSNVCVLQSKMEHIHHRGISMLNSSPHLYPLRICFWDWKVVGDNHLDGNCHPDSFFFLHSVHLSYYILQVHIRLIRVFSKCPYCDEELWEKKSFLK